MDISRIILDLLIKNDTVSVPGLGNFTRKYSPAEVYKFTNRISPPTYQLLFDKKINIPDNSLVNTVKDEYDTTEEEAVETVNKWVANIFETINEGTPYYIKEIGTFKKEEENLKFEVDKNSLLLADNFGLETTKLPLFEIEETTPQPEPISIIPEIAVHRNKNKWIVPVVVILIILSVGGYFSYKYGYVKKGLKAASELVNRFKSDKNAPQFATNDTLQGKIDANTLKRKALQYSEDSGLNVSKQKISAEQTQGPIKYYIISGSFKTLDKAEHHKKLMMTKGFSPQILSFGDTLYRISLASYTIRRQAVDEYIKMTAEDSTLNIWLFSQLASREK